MEYMDVLRHIFDEDMRLLDAKFLRTKAYKTYLQKEGLELSNHYSFKFKKEGSGFIILPYCKETPFYESDLDTEKVGYTKVHCDALDPTICKVLKSKLGSSFTYDEVYVMDHDTFISVELDARTLFEEMTKEELCYYYYYKTMCDVRPQITKNLNDLFFDDQKTERERSDKIRKYQHFLEYYLSELEKRLDTTDKDFNMQSIQIRKTIEDTFKTIYITLEEILLYVERYFSEAIDRKRNLSYLQCKRFIDQYYNPSLNLITLFKKQKLPKNIERAICKPLKSIAQDSLKSFTYIDRHYYITFIDVFTRVLQKNTESTHEDIYKLLIALNFNTHSICKAFEARLLVEMDQFDRPIEKKGFLYTRLVHIKRIAVTAAEKYHQDLPSLKDALMDLIIMNVDLIDQQMELEKYQLEKVSGSDIHPSVGVHGKVKKNRVNMSVHEISLLARLFFETGVVPLEHGKQQYFNFLSSIYKSKESDVISEHSIKNSFYSPPEEVYDPTEDLLVRMISKLHKLRDSTDLRKNG